MIVLHYTALPSCEASLARLCDPAHPSGRVSAHYLVDLDGTVYQLVDESKRAWHSGVGSWRGVADVNSASIGIEIQNVGLDKHGRRVPYPDAQIESLIALCRDIQQRYGISRENIVGHGDVAPTRKQDPGELFPWKRLAEAGVGLWTDDFADSEWPAEKMLASIGYDVSDSGKAIIAFKRHWYPDAIVRGASNTLGRIAAVYELICKGEENAMSKAKRQESIRLTESQVAWLAFLSPDGSPLAAYREVRRRANPLAKDAWFNRGNFRKFVTGKDACCREIAEAVFEAYGTSAEQMDVVKKFKFLLESGASSKPSTNVTDEFFDKCGQLLWRGTAEESSTKRFRGKTTGIKIEATLLDLVSCVLEHKKTLKEQQKFVIFGELLDYLNETHQNRRWPEWMIALSRQPNRDLFKKIRTKSADNCFFPGVKRDAGGRLQYDMAVLGRLTKAELNEWAFFVRRVNMRINEVRYDNFKNVEDKFNTITTQLDSSGLLFSALCELKEKGKAIARNYFIWAKENVKPFLEALRQTNNPNRWYFLMCATRLMYDWSRWHYYSTQEEDKRNACDTFRDIRDLAEECMRDEDASPIVKCRFFYMAATACRYMAEGSSEGIWHGDENAANYASEAGVFASKAVDRFKNSSARSGENLALAYRFRRNCARILTFEARWWLLHPDDFGQPHMDGEESHFADEYDPALLKEASDYYAEAIFKPLGPDEESRDGPVVLRGKRQQEYEFHLRVWLEMLAYQYRLDTRGDNGETAAETAMSVFCRMILIYDYLFKEGKTEDYSWERFTKLTPETAEAARKWLRTPGNDCYSQSLFPGDANRNAGRTVKPPLRRHRGRNELMFDVAQLDKTIQRGTPSLVETRFEVLCAFMFSTSAQERATESSIWRELNKIEKETAKRGASTKKVLEFVEQVWLPTKKALKADLYETCRMMRKATARFYKENDTPEKRKTNWKEYPPFRPYRFNLVAAPGNNSKHVDCLMRHFGFEWDHVIKEMEGAR